MAFLKKQILIIRSQSGPNTQKDSQSKQRWGIRKSEDPTQQAEKVELLLGKGNYGTCHMIFKQGEYFARKTIDFSEVPQRGKKAAYELVKREIESCRKLKHGNIVKFEDTYEVEDESDTKSEIPKIVVILFALCGTTLEHLLLIRQAYANEEKNENETRFEKENVSIIYQIVDSVAYMHEMKIVHRDLKPDNIMLGGNGKIQITDFGCSKSLRLGLKTVIGCQPYMAPDVLAANYTSKCDVWSAGIVAVELVAPQKLYQLWNLYLSKGGDFAQNHQSYTSAVVKQIVDKFGSKCKGKIYKFIRKSVNGYNWGRWSMVKFKKDLFGNYNLESTTAHKNNKIMGKNYLSFVKNGQKINTAGDTFCKCTNLMIRHRREELKQLIEGYDDACICDECEKPISDEYVYRCEHAASDAEDEEEEEDKEEEEEKEETCESVFIHWCTSCAQKRRDMVVIYENGTNTSNANKGKSKKKGKGN